MLVETQIRYVSTCDIYVEAWAKNVEKHPDNNETYSEAHHWKAPRSSLVNERTRLEKGAGFGKKEVPLLGCTGVAVG